VREEGDQPPEETTTRMRRVVHTLKSLPPYPVLFAISPVLSLYAQNTDQVTVQELAIGLGITVLPTILIYCLVLGIAHDGRRAALAAAVFLVFYSLYGTISSGLKMLPIRWITPDTDRRYVLPAWTLLYLLYSLYVLRTPRRLNGLTAMLNASAGFLLAITAGLIALQSVGSEASIRRRESPGSSLPVAAIEGVTRQVPDVYYIVLDGYARSDVLRALYSYDNERFLTELKHLGFVIADDSRSNYCQSILSLASSLNMDYISELLPQAKPNGRSRSPLVRLLRDSSVMRRFRDHGFRAIAFETGYSLTDMTTADAFLRPAMSGLTQGPFVDRILAATPIPVLLQTDRMSGYDLHRKRLEFTFAQLSNLGVAAGRKFVFAHIVAPHPPFVYGAHGEPMEWPWPFSLNDGSHLIRPGGMTRDTFVTAYRDQLHYVNSLTLDTLKSIIEQAEIPPVIVLQADHGPGSLLNNHDAEDTNMGERLSILNAYLIPGEAGIDASAIYDSITPVNTFRIIMNGLFGEELPLLPDRSYYSTGDRPYDFVDVTERAVQEAGE